MLPSTNDFVQNWVQSENSPKEGSIVIADNQTSGKGQAKNKWRVQPNQNLTFSMIYYPIFLPLDRLFALNMVASLAIHNSLKKYTPMAIIKWPNDVLIGDKKCAGILIRNTLSGKKLATSIIGIGLNVNQVAFPTLPEATSLAQATNQQYDKTVLLNEIIAAFENRLLRLKLGGYDALKKDYVQVLYQKGLPSTYTRSDGTSFVGTILDVSEEGQLLVSVHGKIVAFANKAIQF